MAVISGFSFIHNGINGGYPFVEAIKAVQPYVDNVYVVDMQSDDGTRAILEQLGVNVINGHWGNEAGKTLRIAHAQHIHCSGDIIWHFEADEVYDDELCQNIKAAIEQGYDSLKVHRLQVEQNFQRVRWYPETVHRIFPKHVGVFKEGHTTNQHQQAMTLPPINGYLWDCTNCFRDNWFSRVFQQAELRGTEPQCIMAPIHIMHRVEYSQSEIERKLGEYQWAWKETPLKIPELLRVHLGEPRYNPWRNLKEEIRAQWR